MVSLINKFRVFSYLPDKLINDIKYLHINHYSTYKYCLIVTTDDQCHAIGSNLAMLFGGSNKTTQNHLLVAELSNKGVHQFFSGADCLFAITANQEVYCLGSNFHGLMASNEMQLLRPTKIDFFDHKKIINIVICAKQCYALSSDGLLYGWGENRNGFFNIGYNCTYTELFDNDNHMSITCPTQLNQSGQLVKYIDGIRNTDVFVKVTDDNLITYRTEKTKIFHLNSSSHIIKAVVCDDTLFALNDHGELKNFSKILLTDVKDILLVSADEMLALTSKDIVWFFKDKEFRETKFKSFLEYYMKYDEQKSYKTIEVRDNKLYVKDIEINKEFPKEGQYLRPRDTLIESTNLSDPEEGPKESREVTDLKRFKFFRDLAQICDANVKCYYIWGEYDGPYNFAIFFMQNDRVYSTGDNNYGQLGHGNCDKMDSLQFERVYALENKQIEDFFPGHDCIFAKSKDGKIYGWGANWSKEIGMGYHEQDIIPPIEINYFDDKSIIQIQIAKKFCLALSSTGRLYVWFPMEESYDADPFERFEEDNWNQLLDEYEKSHSNEDGDEIEEEEEESEDLVNNKYMLVTFEDGDNPSPRVKYIHCFKEFAFAVTFDGLVYWNRQYERGYHMTSGLTLYRFYNVQDISKVVVHDFGSLQILLLTNKGYVINYSYNDLRVKNQEPGWQFRCNNWFHDKTYYLGKSTPILDILYVFRKEYEHDSDEDSDWLIDNLLESSTPVFQTPTYVYELKVKSTSDIPHLVSFTTGLSQTEYTNFYEYCTQHMKTMYTTVHLSDDGLIMVPQIVLQNDGLQVKLKNVFQNKFETYFEQICFLGQGGYGKVYKVKHRFTQQHFAIKEPFPGNGYSGGSNNITILDEIKMLSKLKSNSVVQYFTAWVETNVDRKENVLYIQMELCSTNLHKILENSPKAFGRTHTQTMDLLEYYLSWHIFKELIESLAYLHDEYFGKTRIIHRDLKPDNVLITDGSDGKFVKIGDFGLAKFYETDLNEVMFGSNLFRAPEISREVPDDPAKANYNHKADIYSLGRIGTLLFDVWNTFADVNYPMNYSDQEDIEMGSEQDEDEEIIPPKYRGTNLESTLRYIIEVMYNCLCVDNFNDRPECEQLLEQINRCGIDANDVRPLFPLYLPNLSEVRERFFIRFLSNKLQVEFDEANVEFEPIEEPMETNFISSLLSSSQPKRKKLKLSI